MVKFSCVSCSNLTSGCNYKAAKKYVRLPNTVEEKLYVRKVFDGINSFRISRELAPLKRDEEIERLAEIHNVCMISRVKPHKGLKISHRNSFDRFLILEDKGYISYGENTAAVRGHQEEQNVLKFVNGWITSPDHYRNIVGDFTHSGVAITIDRRDETIYGTQIFTK